MIEKNIKDLKVAFAGTLDWIKLRDLLIEKFKECKTEKEFSFIIEGLVGSMFKNAKEMDKARKALQLKHITESEKRRINKFTKGNNLK